MLRTLLALPGKTFMLSSTSPTTRGGACHILLVSGDDDGGLPHDGVHTWFNCLPDGDYTFTIYDSAENGMYYDDYDWASTAFPRDFLARIGRYTNKPNICVPNTLMQPPIRARKIKVYALS